MKPASIKKQMIDELENIPEDKLQLLLELIRSSKSNLSDLQAKRKSITDYAGSWKEIDSEQYNAMIKELRDRREKARRELDV
jgi:phosphomannomutase